MPLRCCAYLRISRVEQNNGAALERMKYAAYEATEKLGGVLEEKDIFTDIMSGRKNDRPDFKGLWGLIERKEVDVVIFHRVDRLGRNAVLLLTLRELFQKTGVKAYACEKEKVLNWEDDSDWDYWSNASINSERESRVISKRVADAHKFNRYKKQAAFVAPYGYRRNSDRRYELDLNDASKAKRMIEILEEEDGHMARAVKRIYSELGVKWTSRGFLKWIENPVLRGHTPYGRKKRGQVHETIEYNTHVDFRLMTEERYQRLREMILSRKVYRGNNAEKDPYSLTGLCQCICGASCSVMKSVRHNRNGTTKFNTYIRCRAGDEKYRDLKRHGGNARYEIIEKSVINYLISQANLLIESLTTGIEEEKTPPNPEVLKRQAHIEHLKVGIDRFGDPGGIQAKSIAELQIEIARLQKEPVNHVSSQELRDRLMALNELESWVKLDQRTLRHLFVSFLTKVVINFETGEFNVFLNPFLRL